MDWLADNWGWVVFAVLMLAMHMFGHGSHSRHGDSDEKEDASAKDAPARPSRADRLPHRH